MLKPTKELQKMEEDSENIYLTSLIDRYAARPDSLNDMCLADFAANYSHVRGGGDEDGDAGDVLPTPEQHEGNQHAHIKLKYGLGQALPSGRHSLPQVQPREGAEKLYRSKLMQRSC